MYVYPPFPLGHTYDKCVALVYSYWKALAALCTVAHSLFHPLLILHTTNFK